MQASKDTPTLVKSPPTPPPEKHDYAASDTYTEDEYVVIEWEEDEAERAIDLANSADLSSSSLSATDLASSSHSHLSSSPSEEQMQQSWHGMPYDSNPDQHKAHWYHEWLRDKTVERSDPWGFSSTGVSRTASPARSATA
ncbi:hypothetical protein DBV05_g11830 [Lasiodiplodia theobromae]|uniref:Uncharacterized protein n=1 Tax=Lasiodiplodia theobromae TaxID=45133 RepID=A0A5N5CW04_9PEZI|nr:hypothetical protein DBV05_g11830 [Lasiodiplodia theobromae]